MPYIPLVYMIVQTVCSLLSYLFLFVSKYLWCHTDQVCCACVNRHNHMQSALKMDSLIIILWVMSCKLVNYSNEDTYM